MSHERDELQRELNVARWQLSSIRALADARPNATEDVVDPAYILGLIPVAPPGSAGQPSAGASSDQAKGPRSRGGYGVPYAT